MSSFTLLAVRVAAELVCSRGAQCLFGRAHSRGPGTIVPACVAAYQGLGSRRGPLPASPEQRLRPGSRAGVGAQDASAGLHNLPGFIRVSGSNFVDDNCDDFTFSGAACAVPGVWGAGRRVARGLPAVRCPADLSTKAPPWARPAPCQKRSVGCPPVCCPADLRAWADHTSHRTPTAWCAWVLALQGARGVCPALAVRAGYNTWQAVEQAYGQDGGLTALNQQFQAAAQNSLTVVRHALPHARSALSRAAASRLSAPMHPLPRTQASTSAVCMFSQARTPAAWAAGRGHICQPHHGARAP